MDREFLDKLLEQISVSGCEECGQEVVKSHMQPFSDEIWTDEMGDVICILNPESPVRVMLSAHADENWSSCHEDYRGRQNSGD